MKLTQEAKVIAGVGITTVLLLFGAVFFLSTGQNASAGSSTAESNLLTNNAAHTIGEKSAKVVITEFADYQCPACAAANPVLNEIKKEYEGRVSFVYRHFPLPQHQNARSAIYAAEAAGEQGKFWEMSDLLYQNQSEWSESNNPIEVYLKYAVQLNLDQKAWSDLAGSKKYENLIQTDLQDARAIGVNSTPTVYINNQKFTKALTTQNLKTAIDQELNK